MAYKKISELSGVTNPNLTGITVVVDNGTTYKSTLRDLRNVLVDSGSHYFTGSQIINGDLIISGSLTAQQYILSSSISNILIESISGSTSFGNSLDDNHIFTGSIKVFGPVSSSFFVGDGSQLTNLPIQEIETGSFAITGSNIFVGNQTISGSKYLAVETIQNLSGSLSLITAGGNVEILASNLNVPNGGIITNYNVSASSLTGSLDWSHIINEPSLISGSSQISNLGYATTGSNTFVGNQTITGSIYLDMVEQIKVGDFNSINGGEGTLTLQNTNGYITLNPKEGGSDTLFNVIGQTGEVDIFMVMNSDGGAAQLSFNKSGSLNINTNNTVIPTLLFNDVLYDAHLATTGSNTFIGTEVISGSLYVTEVIETTNIQGTGSLYLKPDVLDTRDFRIYNTAPSDIHIKGNASYSFFGDDINFLKIDDNTSTITLKSTSGTTIDGLLSIKGVIEDITLDTGFSGNRDFDYTSGSIFYLTGITGNGTWNVNSVPTDDNKAITLTFIISQGVTPYSGSQYQINSSNVTVKWVDNTVPTGSANNIDVIGLSAFRVGSSWNVIGSLSTFGV